MGALEVIPNHLCYRGWVYNLTVEVLKLYYALVLGGKRMWVACGMTYLGGQVLLRTFLLVASLFFSTQMTTSSAVAAQVV
jgi:hypothetical protein